MAQMKKQDNNDLVTRFVKKLDSEKVLGRTLSEFADQKTFCEKIDFVLASLKKYNLLPKFFEDKKNNERSSRIRKKTNKKLTGKSVEALEAYCHSVAIAEAGTLTLGLAYNKRSEALENLKREQDALDDIERALEVSNVRELRETLLTRQKKIKHLMEEPIIFNKSPPVIKEEDKNMQIECASNCVKITTDRKYGRCVIATRDIEMGETIAVEKATYSMLLEGKWCHCHHCLKLSYCLVPCDKCTQALFCDNQCKENAKKYHDYECPILATLHSLNISTRLLPLRIAILLKDDYKQLEEELKKEEPVYRSNRYKEIHYLVTNLEQRDSKNLLEKATTSAILFHVLKENTDFFENADEAFINSFKQTLMHIALVMSINFHQIQELNTNIKPTEFRLSTIGAGAYNFLSLINHSCVPNCYRVSYGTTNVLKAILTIRKGEQLFECYRMDYTYCEKKKRRELLKKEYFFDCECRACTRNWPVLNKLPKFNLIQDYRSMGNIIQIGITRVENESRTGAKLFEPRMPCLDFCHLQELMIQCHCLLGNVKHPLKIDENC